MTEAGTDEETLPRVGRQEQLPVGHEDPGSKLPRLRSGSSGKTLAVCWRVSLQLPWQGDPFFRLYEQATRT